MKNIKKHLLERTEQDIEEKEEEIEDLKEGLEILNADIAVEKKFLEMENIPEKIKKDRKYILQAKEDMRDMKKDEIEEKKRELKGLEYKDKVIRKFKRRALDRK